MSDDAPPHSRTAVARRWLHVAAAGAYLVLALWTLRAVVPAPASLLPLPAWAYPNQLGIVRSDQDYFVFALARNARKLVSSPGEIFEAGACYPTRRAVTLGEHLLAQGFLGAPVLALSGDPILTANAVLLLTYLIGAMAIYALVFRWTGSAAGAFVAGLVYAFHPLRIEDPMHPNIVGNHWTALALLFADRLFERRRWLDAIGLGLCLSAQLLESFYTVIGLVLIGTVFGLRLAGHHVRALPNLLPKIGVAAAMSAVTAWLVYGPYLETRAIWSTLGGRRQMLHLPAHLGFGGRAYLGTVVLLLGVIALADRLRGRRGRLPGSGGARDARLVLALTAVLLAWTIVFYVPLPFTDARLPSLWPLAAGLIPGADAVRAGGALRLGLVLLLALLAGYGVAVLTAGRSRAVATAIVLVVSGLWLVETVVPAVAVRAFGRAVHLAGRVARPPDETVLLYRQIDSGAVLDLPLFETGSLGGNLAQASDYLLLHAYHDRPAGACNNSFIPELPLQIAAMARQLSERPWKLDAVAALGFRYLLVHPDDLPPERRDGLARTLELLERQRPGHARLVPVGADGLRRLYRIEDAPKTHSRVDALTFAAESVVLPEDKPVVALLLRVSNGSGETFVHPQPIVPTTFTARWHSLDGVPLEDVTTRALLPPALGVNDRYTVRVEVPLPSARGALLVDLVPAADPDTRLATWTVEVPA